MHTPWRPMLGLLAAFACISTAGAAALPERKVHRAGETEIEANAGDEAYVDALNRELAKSPTEETPVAVAVAQLPFSLEDLATHRNRVQAKICGYLALEKPSDFMTKAYDGVPDIWRSFQRLTIRQPGRFALWRKADVLAHFDAGEKVPGFVREGKDGLRVDLQVHFDFKDEATAAEREAGEAAAWRALVWPVKIGDNQTPEQVAATGMQQLQDYRRSMAGVKTAQLQFSQVFNVLHETIESGIVWSYITSRDRRWFCDGMANYLAWKILAEEIGPDAARQYYDLDAELRKFAAEAPQVNLAAWPAAENLAKAGYREQLNTANYAYATKVIADFCAKHGEAWMPKVFREIARTPPQKANMDTVYRAVRKVTGDDLRKYLPKPPKQR